MLRKLLPALALFSFAGAAQAGDKPLYAPAPAWVKPAPAIDAAKLTDADPILLMVDQQQRLEDGETAVYFDMATRIASPQLLTQLGTLPLPWDPGKGDLTIHRVEILRGAERIDVLATGSRFEVLRREQQLEQAALSGMLTATLPVEGLRVGDVLRVSFSTTRKDPALGGNVQTVAPIAVEPMRLNFGRTRIIWPRALDLRWRAHHKGAEVQPVDTPDGYREMTIEMPVEKPGDIPDDAPARYRPLPIVEATSYAGWGAVSKGMAPLYRTAGTIAPGGPIAAEVARIAAASRDPRTRAALALELVQDKVRYLFRGMDDGNYVPQTPLQTWTLRYGDCKAKTLLLLAMLRELGIEAEAVLVHSDMGEIVPVRLPMPGTFNHVIVRATIGGASLWLDGTGNGARLADLDDVPPFRHALPLREGGAELLAMPLRPNARPAADVEIEIDASAGINFPMPYEARITLRGGNAEMLRMTVAQSGPDEADAMVDAILTTYLGKNEAVGRKITHDDEAGTALITASGLTYSDWTRQAGRYQVQLDKTVDDMSFTPDRGRAAWKEIPVAGGATEDRRVRTRIKLPRGGAGFTLAGNRTLPPRLGTSAVAREVTLADGWIGIDDRISTGFTEVAPAEIPAARAQLARAKAQLLRAIAPADYPPPFREVAAGKRAKAFDAILAVYDKAVAERPDDAGQYTDRAWFLERIHDREGAIRDLDEAIELAPDVATYLWRARLHVALGATKAARADADAALALDPASEEAIRRLAWLRFEAGEKDEALAMIAEQAANGGKDGPNYVMIQSQLLSDLGRVDESLALLDETIASSPGSPDLLNQRCWVKGTRGVALDTALRDCTKSIELSENPAAALDSRAMVYFRMDRFDDAIADLDGALAHSPDQAASLFLRGVVRKRMGDKAADEDLGAARLLDPQVDRDYAKYGIKP